MHLLKYLLWQKFPVGPGEGNCLLSNMTIVIEEAERAQFRIIIYPLFPRDCKSTCGLAVIFLGHFSVGATMCRWGVTIVWGGATAWGA